jgi:uncharacterized protein YecT (DUF1311 family)
MRLLLKASTISPSSTWSPARIRTASGLFASASAACCVFPGISLAGPPPTPSPLALPESIASPPPVAQGAKPARASFDCARASSGVEAQICARPDVAEKDRRMGEVYRALVREADARERARLTHTQAAWVKRRDAECTTPSPGCLDNLYDERLSYLELELGSGLYKLPRSGRDVGAFVPTGWHIEATFEGDLTGDTLADLAVALAESRERGKRAIVVLQRSTDGQLLLLGHNSTILISQGDGGMKGDAPDMAIEGGALSIRTIQGSCSFSTRDLRFRLNQASGRLRLVFSTENSYDNCEGGSGDHSSTSAVDHLTGIITRTASDGRITRHVERQPERSLEDVL